MPLINILFCNYFSECLFLMLFMMSQNWIFVISVCSMTSSFVSAGQCGYDVEKVL